MVSNYLRFKDCAIFVEVCDYVTLGAVGEGIYDDQAFNDIFVNY